MKRILLALAVAIMLTATAAAVNPAAPNGLTNGKSDVRHLYLFEKAGFCNYNYGDDCWYIVDDGAWGKMTFGVDRFWFNGHSLEPNIEYCLIYYADPWPGAGSMILGSSESNNGGNVHIKGEFDFTVIPHHEDENYEEGAKIWLVPCEDLTEDKVAHDIQFYKLSAWNPAEYLFEYSLI